MNIKLFRRIVEVTLLPMLCLPLAVWAGESGKTGYIIKKGDTLWDISSDKLKDPFQWKALWKLNHYIKNPDLIYPGQKLVVPVGLKGDNEAESPKDEDAAEKPVKVKASNVMAGKQILIAKHDYIVSREVLINSGYIAPTPPSGDGRIVASPERRILVGRTDPIYIETTSPAADKTRFYVLSQPERVVHPVTGDVVGYLVRTKGAVETIGVESGNTKAMVVESFEEVLKGDILFDYYSIDLPLKPTVEKRPQVNGHVVKVHDGDTVVGPRNIVYLDKGIADGVTVGDLFTVETGRKPIIPIGTVQIISAQDKTSVAFIVKASDIIQAGDSFKN